MAGPVLLYQSNSLYFRHHASIEGKVTGRNERCPCGSGKKFKKCCMNRTTPRIVNQPPPQEVVDHAAMAIQQKLAAQQAWTARYGHVRPCIATDFHGHKCVAAGNKLYYSERWKFVADFLLDYIPNVFGKAWGDGELAKPEQEQHPLVQCRVEAIRYMNAQTPQADGTYVATTNGVLESYMAFAFNLFAIEDNSRFDDLLLERLKNKEQFQGARHEVFVEATCLRAGFSIEHENERDRTHRHAEFTAKHKATGQLLSIEAKSKHRAGVLGQPGVPQPHEKLSLRFGQLLKDAI